MLLLRDIFLGFIKLHILHHARHEPVYGLWLIGELAVHGYRLSPGTLYPILHGMIEDGLLASEYRVVDGKRRKYYRLTSAGEHALLDGKNKARELLAEIEQNNS